MNVVDKDNGQGSICGRLYVLFIWGMFRSKRCYSSGKIFKNIFGKAVLAQQAQILFNWVNMVRVGVVSHPSEWAFGGYNEIQSPRRKCVLINHEQLANPGRL